MGVVKLAKGEPAEALRLVSAAMRLRKPSPQILLNHGMILHALERSEEALASFDAALKQKSKFAEAHNNRGAVLAALGRDEEALALLHRGARPQARLCRRPLQPRLLAARARPLRRGAGEPRSRAGAATPIMPRRTTTAAR